LNVTSASGSNTTSVPNYIALAAPAPTPTSAPVPAFTASPRVGTVPLTVTFTDQSAGSPTSWNWSFGDGNFSEAQNPTYPYTRSGTFTVSLASTNNIGSNIKTEVRYITVSALTQNATMNMNGTTVQTAGGIQNVVVNLTSVNGTVTQPDTNTVIIQNPGSGWSQMKLVSNNSVANQAGNLNVTDLSQVVMTTNPLTAALNQTTLGTVTAQISIPMNQVPTSVTIEQNIIEGANASAITSFQLAATDSNLNINDVAYTVEIKNTAALNANLTGAADPVKLNLSVSHAWVVANGGINSIRIIRSAEDGTRQVLTTRFLFNDPLANMDYFEADSPNGLSLFGIAAVSESSPSVPSYVSSPDSGSSNSPISQIKSTDMKTPPDPEAGPWTSFHMNGNTRISQINVQTIGSIPDLFILSETVSSLPQGISKPEAPVYGYHKIDLYRATNDDVNQAVIEFTVSESWLNGQKMTAHDVQLLRYHENAWEKLPTEYVGKKDGNLIFRATSTGFSYFATALIKNATNVADAESTPVITSSAMTEQVQETAAPVVKRTLAVSQIPDTPEQEAMTIPIFLIGVVGVIVITVSAVFIRRWWIRRQNPALFREYD
jgi:PGF-pre-PGF domain-containing protein